LKTHYTCWFPLKFKDRGIKVFQRIAPEFGSRKVVELCDPISAHPEMANLPDICVVRKILSSEYQPYACGKIFRTP
jgi:hypothetical protein